MAEARPKVVEGPPAWAKLGEFTRFLSVLPDYDKELVGWKAIRAFLGQMGMSAPHGPRVDTMRCWRKTEHMPVFTGRFGSCSRPQPRTTRALLVGWMLWRSTLRIEILPAHARCKRKIRG